MKIFVNMQPVYIKTKKPLGKAILEAAGFNHEEYELFWLPATRPKKKIPWNFQTPVTEGKQYAVLRKTQQVQSK